uniref:Uncharacterized protein n=1 Tax=Tanacetum cinerariifolium TaxID=118510 RepID=A0A699K974_TANCI|nr:hypothetical protein [Tanacetum cinerariifolium]
MTPVTIGSGLVQKLSSSTPYVPPLRNDWDLTFQPMFDKLLNPPPSVDHQAPEVIAPIADVIPLVQAKSTGSPSLTTVDQDVPSPSKSQTTPETQSSVIPQDVEEDIHNIKVAQMGNDLLFGVPIPKVTSAQSSSTPVSTRLQLHEQALFCYYDAFMTLVKMEGNKSIHRSNEQRNLYKALVEAYESDKIILDIYRDTVTLKRRRDDDADKDEKPFAGTDRGSKRRRKGKEPDKSATAEEPMHTTFAIEEPSHPEFNTGADDQPIVESSQHPECFSQQKKPPTPDHDWNKTLLATHESIQPWISELAKQSDSLSSFNELMDTPMDFSNFLINRLKVDTLILKLLAGPTYELMKGSCKSLVELELFLEDVYKATTDQLDWRNLYKALVEAYESDKIILGTYRETVTLKRRRDDDADKDEEPSAGSDRGSKRRREGKEPDSTSASESAAIEEPMQTTFEMEEPSHLEFETGADDQPIVELCQHPEWFSQQKKPPTLDRDWNKTLSATHRSIQPWISELAK